MDRSEVLTLISYTYTADSIGQRVPVPVRRKVFCRISSVTQSEFYEAGRSGIKAQLRASVFAPDYKDEDTVEYKGKKYGIYRTYLAANEEMELYLERKAGA